MYDCHVEEDERDEHDDDDVKWVEKMEMLFGFSLGFCESHFRGRTKVGGVGISYLRPTNHNLCGKWGSGNERPLWPPIRIAEQTTYHGHSSHYYYDDDEGWTTRKLWFRKLNGMEMLFSSCGGCCGGWLMHCCSYLYNTSGGSRKQIAE